jgi:hypothetical protein
VLRLVDASEATQRRVTLTVLAVAFALVAVGRVVWPS